jgi:hypothetical protein
MKFVRRLSSIILTVSLVFALGSSVLAAGNGTVNLLRASASSDSVHVIGETENVKAAVTVQILDENKTIIGMGNLPVTNNSFSGDIPLDSKHPVGVGSSLTVRAADYDGGTWDKMTGVTVEVATLGGFRIRLDSSIGVDYYVALSEDLQEEETKITFTYDSLVSTSCTQEVTFDAENTRRENNQTYFIFTCRVNAPEMNLPIKAVLTNERRYYEVEFKEFRVRDYANVLINDNPNDQTSNLAKALLNYGYYAQVKFAPQFERFEEDRLPLSTPNGAPRGVAVPSGVTYEGSTVVFLSGTRIRHYFTVTGDEAEFYVNGVKCEPKQSGSEIYITTDIVEILSSNEPIHVNIICDGKDENFEYSVEDYVYAVLQSPRTSEPMKDLVKAYYDYYQAAIAYRASNP